jgi:hypothetical protein
MIYEVADARLWLRRLWQRGAPAGLSQPRYDLDVNRHSASAPAPLSTRLLLRLRRAMRSATMQGSAAASAR